jgi:hypothetical protein
VVAPTTDHYNRDDSNHRIHYGEDMTALLRLLEGLENIVVICGGMAMVWYVCYKAIWQGTRIWTTNGGLPMENMDKIDAKQQLEIESLKRKDVGHDRELIFYRVFGVVIVLVQVGLFVMLMQTLERQGPYNCPHPDCVHHRAN